MMGGHFKWEDLGNDKYRITAIVFTNCNAPNLSNLPIKINGNCSGITKSSQSMSSGVDVTPICANQCSRCDSKSCPFRYGIRRYELSTIIDVKQFKKNSCCTVEIGWSYNRRLSAISTGAYNNSFYMGAEFNVCQNGGNHSPVFSDQMAKILCLGQDAIMYVGADQTKLSKFNNDSLVYSLVDPEWSKNRSTKWNSPYTSQKPITYLGFPKDYSIDKFPFGFHLDSFSGELKFRPMKLQTTIMAIQVEVFRNGVKTGTLVRDFSISVIKCSNNTPPVISGIKCSKPKSRNFEAHVCAGQPICFNICTSDKDTADSVTLNWDGGIPNASFSILNKNARQQDARFCWTPSAKDTLSQPYRFVVTAKDNSCPLKKATQRVFSIYVSDSTRSEVTFSKKAINKECRIYELTASTINQAQYEAWGWRVHDTIPIGSSRKNDSSTITYTFKDNGRIPITLYTLNGVCHHIFRDTLEVTGTSPIKHVSLVDTSVCIDKNYNTPIIAAGGNKPLKFSWEFDGSLYSSDTIDIDFNGKIGGGKINYSIEDSLGCKEEHTFYVSNKSVRTDPVDSDYVICQNSNNKRIDLKAASIINHELTRGQWMGKDVTDSTFDGANLPSGVYKLFYYGEANSFCVTDTISVDIRDNPKVNAGYDQLFCSSTLPVTLLGSPKGGTWWSSGNKVSTGIFYPQLADSLINTLFYKHIDSFGCTATDKILFTKSNHKPIVSAGRDLNLCDNQRIVLKRGQPEGGIWSGPFISANNKDTTYELVTQQVLQDTAFKAFYEIRDSSGCKNTDSIQIEVRPTTHVQIPEQIIHCFSGNAVDTAVLVGQPKGGKWTGNGTFFSDSELEITVPDIGRQTVNYYYEAANGCRDSASTVLWVREKPKIAIEDDTICVKKSYPYVLDAKPTGGIWSGVGVLKEAGRYKVYVGEKKQGAFSYKYEFEDQHGCSSVKRMKLYAGTKTTSDFLPSAKEGDAPLVVDFKNRSENGKFYKWDFGNGTTSTDFRPRATYLDSGIYTVSLVVVDSTGFCKSESSQEITVSPSSGVLTPVSKQLISIYPSLASNEIKVQNLSQQPLQLSIVSINGQILLEMNIDEDSVIDISSLSSGIYMLRTTDQKSRTQMTKLVVE